MKVIIIGAGISGPLLAMLLKHKGFEAVVYEKHAHMPSGGLALNLSPQVFKVLDIIGLAHEALSLGVPADRMIHRSELTGKVLQDIEVRSRVTELTGWPMCIMIRSKFCHFTVEKMKERDIPLHWGKELAEVKQEGDKVTAVFADGTSDEGDLLAGCDGIHSKVRDSLFGPTPAEHTGLVGFGGFTPYTEELHPTGPVCTQAVWGRDYSFLSIPTADGKYFWASTVPDRDEALEDWKMAGNSKLKEMIIKLPFIHWSGEVGKIVSGSEEVVRFGLYLRPIPPVWHKGRAVLLGDAAHPTTPFLGQGANQSSEDVYHLVRALVRNQPLTSESIEKAFSEYTAIRLPRATKAVEQSKREAEYRLLKSDEDVKARDEMRAKGLDSDTWKVIMEAMKGPFTGQSEI